MRQAKYSETDNLSPLFVSVVAVVSPLHNQKDYMRDSEKDWEEERRKLEMFVRRQFDCRWESSLPQRRVPATSISVQRENSGELNP